MSSSLIAEGRVDVLGGLRIVGGGLNANQILPYLKAISPQYVTKVPVGTPARNVFVYDHVMAEKIDFLQGQVLMMRARIDELHDRLAEFLGDSRVEDTFAPPDDEQAAPSDEELKIACANYFESHDGEEVFPSDLAIAFSVEYTRIEKAIRELEADGRVRAV